MGSPDLYLACCCAPVSAPAHLCEAAYTPASRMRYRPSGVAGIVLQLPSVAATQRVVLRLRRRGYYEWMLEYPVLMRRPDGSFVFRFDAKMETLQPGRYDAFVFVDDTPCVAVEITIPKMCPAESVAVAPLLFHGQVDPEPPQEINDVFLPIATFSADLTQPLATGATVIPLSDTARTALCGATLCRPVELVLDDGVQREVVLFEGCVGGAVVVKRGLYGAPPAVFPRGSQLRFVWTPANVQAACEGCP